MDGNDKAVVNICGDDNGCKEVSREPILIASNLIPMRKVKQALCKLDVKLLE